MEVIKAFQPYYDRKLGYVTSRKHEEKLFGELKVSPINDHWKMKKEAENMRNHREELVQEQYAKEGIKYVPGSNTKFDEKHNEFRKVKRR